MRIWIDIDNPPQVQYLTPFVETFERMGHVVLVTARDNGMTYELLQKAGTNFVPIAREFGNGRAQKVIAGFRRAYQLRQRVQREGNIALLLGSSRPSALAARSLGIPSYIICDYEHVELKSYRRSGASLLFPDVIDRSVFEEIGFPADRLYPFRGLKEDITFARRDLTETSPLEPTNEHRLIQVLIRPPAESSHYSTERSTTLLHDVLGVLAGRDDIRAVISPRQPAQARRISEYKWINDPIVLNEAVSVVSLLKAVDWVICSGGTMLREAAYLGTPAIGIFGGPTGSVDAYLASLGAVSLISDASELLTIDWRREKKKIVPHRLDLVNRIADEIVSQVEFSNAGRDQRV